MDSKVCTAQVYSPVMFQSGFFIDITPGLPSMVNILVSIFAFMKPYKVGGGNEQKKKANFMLINFLPSVFDFRPPE